MSKNLSLYTQGIKGGHTGYANICLDSEKIISVDNFKGHSDNYTQRENPVICIFDGEDVVFEGTHEQLIKKLNNKL